MKRKTTFIYSSGRVASCDLPLSRTDKCKISTMMYDTIKIVTYIRIIYYIMYVMILIVHEGITIGFVNTSYSTLMDGSQFIIQVVVLSGLLQREVIVNFSISK